jgi:hypothetical protein
MVVGYHQPLDEMLYGSDRFRSGTRGLDLNAAGKTHPNGIPKPEVVERLRDDSNRWVLDLLLQLEEVSRPSVRRGPPHVDAAVASGGPSRVTVDLAVEETDGELPVEPGQSVYSTIEIIEQLVCALSASASRSTFLAGARCPSTIEWVRHEEPLCISPIFGAVKKSPWRSRNSLLPAS